MRHQIATTMLHLPTKLRSESDHSADITEPRRDTTLWLRVADRTRNRTNSVERHRCLCGSNDAGHRCGSKVAGGCQCESNYGRCRYDSNAVACRLNEALCQCELNCERR